jgi:hypothetical protein
MKDLKMSKASRRVGIVSCVFCFVFNRCFGGGYVFRVSYPYSFTIHVLLTSC